MVARMSTMEPLSMPTLPGGRRRLFLASRSARRRRLLEEAGIAHEVRDSGIDDGALSPAPGLHPAAWVRALAYMKARAAALRLGAREASGAIVLGADTVVVKDGAVIGQARDERDAERILRTLAGGRHRVVTGVALVDLDRGRRRLLHDVAEVEVGPLPEDLIWAYMASGGWRGKAGAYNLMERVEAGWPIRYAGDPGTIMGLPMRGLAPTLRTMLGDAG